MTEELPEVWLRGAIESVPPVLMPAAHALLGAAEDLERLANDLTPEELHARPGGAASVAFHLRHVAGSVDRLLTYARGAALDDSQRAALKLESEAGGDAEVLVSGLRSAVNAALRQLRETPEEEVFESREVGRARLPSTVLGLLFHAAEHAQRHTGQAIATARAARAGLR
jgi:uncharacterized damage-inducible protein DinB